MAGIAGIAALIAAYMLSQFYRSFLAVQAGGLTSDIGMDATSLSNALGAWFLTFALAQFVVGPSLDRYGPRLTASILIAVFAGGGAALFALSQEPWMVVLAMGMIGIGCAPVLMANYFIFAREYSVKRFAVLSSWVIGVGSLGNIIGASPLAYANEAFGWRSVMWGLCAITVLVAVLVFLLVKDPRAATVADSEDAAKGSYLDLLKIPQLWPIFLLLFVSYASVAGIRGVWAGPYLNEVFGLDDIQVGNIMFWMAVAMAASAFVYGPLDSLFGTTKWVVLTGTVFMLACILAMALIEKPNLFLVSVMFVGIGVFSMSYAVLMSHGKSFYPPHLMGRGVTLANFFSIGGVGVFQWITGWWVAREKAIAVAQGLPVAAPYQSLFMFYAVLIVIALAYYLFSKDHNPNA